MESGSELEYENYYDDRLCNNIRCAGFRAAPWRAAASSSTRTTTTTACATTFAAPASAPRHADRQRARVRELLRRPPVQQHSLRRLPRRGMQIGSELEYENYYDDRLCNNIRCAGFRAAAC